MTYRNRVVSGVIVLGLLLLVACSGEGEGDQAEGAACSSTADCRGGQVCRENRCVPFSDPGSSPDGDLPDDGLPDEDPADHDGDVSSDGDTGDDPPGDGDADPSDGDIPDGDWPDGDDPDGDTADGDDSSGAYSVCHANTECPPDLKCVTVRSNPLSGWCTKNCTQDDECPQSPTNNPVGCHEGICVSLCGVYGGVCPPGLVCVAMEFCLEESGTQATKGPGETCGETAECIDAECVEGENTGPYCAPYCTSDADCSTAAPGSVGTCAASGSLQFCMYFCGMMAGGAPCPGDMWCEGNAICR